MKAGWEVKPLGEVCDYFRGLTYKKADEVEHSTKRILRANNIDRETSALDYSEIRYLREEFDIPIAKKVTHGSILICTASGSKSHLGKVALIDTDEDFAFGGFMGLIAPKDGLLPQFLHYAMTSKMYLDFIDQNTDGANINNLKFSQLAEFSFPIPPLEEQKQIVAVLDAAFEGLTRAKKNAEANLQNARELFHRSLDTFYIADLAGWPSISLGEISDIRGGKRLPKGRELQQEKTDWPYIRVADFDGRGGVCLDDIRYLSKDIRDTIKRYTISSDDVFITIVGATVGKSGIVPIELSGANLTENACKLVLCDKVSAKYIYYFTLSTSFLDQVGLNTRTAAQPKLALIRLKTISLGLPPLDHQVEVSKKLNELRLKTEQAEANYRTKLTDIADLRQSLLQKAFAGALT